MADMKDHIILWAKERLFQTGDTNLVYKLDLYLSFCEFVGDNSVDECRFCGLFCRLLCSGLLPGLQGGVSERKRRGKSFLIYGIGLHNKAPTDVDANQIDKNVPEDKNETTIQISVDMGNSINSDSDSFLSDTKKVEYEKCIGTTIGSSKSSYVSVIKRVTTVETCPDANDFDIGNVDLCSDDICNSFDDDISNLDTSTNQIRNSEESEKIEMKSISSFFTKTKRFSVAATSPISHYVPKQISFRQQHKENSVFFDYLVFSRHCDHIQRMTAKNMPCEFDCLDELLLQKLPKPDLSNVRQQEIWQRSAGFKNSNEMVLMAFLCSSFKPVVINSVASNFSTFSCDDTLPQFSVVEGQTNV